MCAMFKCPDCGCEVENARNPAPTVDIIIYNSKLGVVLVKRKFPPLGWALPGGFIDYGETAEHAAVREAMEETSLDVRLRGLLGVYSDPARDPRKHTMSVVFWAECEHPERLAGGDDAAEAVFHSLDSLPELAFDHAKIISDFKARLAESKLDERY